MKTELRMVHFQLTKCCNLRCYFCGQDHTVGNDELSKTQWFSLLDQLKEYAPGATVVLWGGEPLLSAHFREVVLYAAELGFPLELISNGTLIDKHTDLLREHFERIFISVDGPEAIHDSIRGSGVFAKVRENLALLKGSHSELIMMTVLSPETLPYACQTPFGLGFDRVILHKMIYLTQNECEKLKPEEALLWRKNENGNYEKLLAETLLKLEKNEFPVPVEFQGHNNPCPCLEPYRHLHITSNGETSFCTDFTQYTLGNVKRRTIKEIFEGKEAVYFRKNGNMPYCRHCSWKNNLQTILQFKH